MDKFLILIICSAVGYYPIVRQMKWLTAYGYQCAILLAFLILMGPGYFYFIYPLFFLISGSILSKIEKVKDDFDKDTGRDGWQVLSNAGTAMLCCIVLFITENSIYSEAFILAFCVANADTWSSELGKMYGGKPYDIMKFKKMEIGLSGGVSLIGTMAGILGSFVMVSLAYLINHLPFEKSILIGILGATGMILDSVYGSILQGKYLVNHQIKEKGKLSELVNGYHWMTNNKVNFISITTIVLLYIIVSL